MGSIEVTPSVLRSTAKEVEAKAGEYAEHYKDLYTWVNEFTDSDYRGEEADAFRTRIEGFQDDFNSMNELMGKYAQYLRDSAQRYEEAEDQARAQISSLQN